MHVVQEIAWLQVSVKHSYQTLLGLDRLTCGVTTWASGFRAHLTGRTTSSDLVGHTRTKGNVGVPSMSVQALDVRPRQNLVL